MLMYKHKHIPISKIILQLNITPEDVNMIQIYGYTQLPLAEVMMR